MKTLLALAATLALSLPAVAAEHAHDHTLVTPASAPWQETGLPGVQLALAWGSEEAGDAVWLLRMAPGVALPAHTHTNDYWGLTVQGNWVHIHEDGSETASAPGDYTRVPGGVLHGDRCDGDIPCIGLLDFDGIRDAIFPN